MFLPNKEAAIVELAKLTEYCLNAEHPVGKHKARVFAAAFGFTVDDAARLRTMLLAAAQSDQAVISVRDQYGQRYVVDFTVVGLEGPVTIRSVWIFRAGADGPRLVTCQVL